MTGLVEATDRETTAQYGGCGQVTRPRQLTAKRGQGPGRDDGPAGKPALRPTAPVDKPFAAGRRR